MTLRDGLENRRALVAAWSRQTIDKWDVLGWFDALLSTSRAEPVTPLRKGLEDAFRAGQRLGLWQMKYTGPDNVPPQPIPPGEDETLDALLSTADSEQREVVDLADETLPLMPTGKYTRPAEQQEVADLRRKLEEAVREKNLATVEAIGHDHAEGHLSALVDELRSQLSDASLASLANAALRTALVYKPHGSYNCCRLCGQTWWDDQLPNHSPGCIVALPTDGLAEEVVWLLTHIPADIHEDPLCEPVVEWYRRRDALLARIGGKT